MAAFDFLIKFLASGARGGETQQVPRSAPLLFVASELERFKVVCVVLFDPLARGWSLGHVGIVLGNGLREDDGCERIRRCP